MLGRKMVAAFLPRQVGTWVGPKNVVAGAMGYLNQFLERVGALKAPLSLT